MSQRTTVFVSYSRTDSRWLQRLQVHLKPFARRGDLVLWDDTKIDPGDRWRSAIREAIERAAASVLLISADFLASDFVASEELPPLLEKAETSGARIIPIIVQPCRLMNHPELAKFQSLNSPSKPLSKLSDAEVEEVFVSAAEQVERVLATRRHTAKRAPGGDAGSPVSASETLFDELQAAAVTLSVLVALSKSHAPPADQTLTELTRLLDLRSRKLAYDSVDRLSRAGWIVKRRVSGRTQYHISDEGLRQLQRLATAAGGPVRMAVAHS
jgi:hypothetical protein